MYMQGGSPGTPDSAGNSEVVGVWEQVIIFDRSQSKRAPFFHFLRSQGLARISTWGPPCKSPLSVSLFIFQSFLLKCLYSTADYGAFH
jgi:hypothetical protein